MHGFNSIMLADENGDPAPVYSNASGLDYPAAGPEHALLHDLDRVKYTTISDEQAIEALFLLSRHEGIIPAIESSHALAYAIKVARTGKTGSILVNLSGRGDKDLDFIVEHYGYGPEFLKKMEERNDPIWAVPYLPIDPKDVGREYEPIIRINSQSGRGGIAYVMETYFGVQLPKRFQRDFLPVVKAATEAGGIENELTPQQIFDLFDDKFINVLEPYGLKNFSEQQDSDQVSTVDALITYNGEEIKINGKGNGLLDAFVSAFCKYTGVEFSISNYSEHAMKSGSDSAAITYIEITNKANKHTYIGAGVSSSVTKSSVRAVVCAFNRMISVL